MSTTSDGTPRSDGMQSCRGSKHLDSERRPSWLDCANALPYNDKPMDDRPLLIRVFNPNVPWWVAAPCNLLGGVVIVLLLLDPDRILFFHAYNSVLDGTLLRNKK